MIIEFNISQIDDCFFAVAVMSEGPVVEIGVFEEFDEAEEACDRFAKQHQKHLH